MQSSYQKVFTKLMLTKLIFGQLNINSITLSLVGVLRVRFLVREDWGHKTTFLKLGLSKTDKCLYVSSKM